MTLFLYTLSDLKFPYLAFCVVSCSVVSSSNYKWDLMIGKMLLIYNREDALIIDEDIFVKVLFIGEIISF